MRGIESDYGNVSGNRNCSEDGANCDNDIKQRLHISVFESTIFTYDCSDYSIEDESSIVSNDCGNEDGANCDNDIKQRLQISVLEHNFYNFVVIILLKMRVQIVVLKVTLVFSMLQNFYLNQHNIVLFYSIGFWMATVVYHFILKNLLAFQWKK